MEREDQQVPSKRAGERGAAVGSPPAQGAHSKCPRLPFPLRSHTSRRRPGPQGPCSAFFRPLVATWVRARGEPCIHLPRLPPAKGCTLTSEDSKRRRLSSPGSGPTLPSKVRLVMPRTAPVGEHLLWAGLRARPFYTHLAPDMLLFLENFTTKQTKTQGGMASIQDHLARRW